MSSPGEGDNDAPKPKFKFKKGLIRLVGSAVLLTLVFHFVGREAIVSALSSVRAGPWALALLGFLAMHAFSALKWRFFLGLCGAPIPMKLALRAYAAALFANLCLPSLVGGDVVKAGLAMQASKNKTGVLLGSVADRLADVTALGLLVGLGAVLAPSAAEALHGGAIQGIWVLAGGLVLLGIGTAVGYFVMLRLPLRKLPRKVAKLLIGMLRALRKLASTPGLALLGLCWCLSLQAGFVLLNVPLGEMVGLNLDVRLWLLLWPLAKVAAMLPLSLGGLGGREAAFGLLVTPFAESRLAVAESLVWQSVLIAGGLLAGAFFMLTRGASRDDSK